jgi:hypothetical protein
MATFIGDQLACSTCTTSHPCRPVPRPASMRTSLVACVLSQVHEDNQLADLQTVACTWCTKMYVHRPCNVSQLLTYSACTVRFRNRTLWALSLDARAAVHWLWCVQHQANDVSRRLQKARVCARVRAVGRACAVCVRACVSAGPACVRPCTFLHARACVRELAWVTACVYACACRCACLAPVPVRVHACNPTVCVRTCVYPRA